MNPKGLRTRLLLSLSAVLAVSFLLFGVAEFYTLRSAELGEVDRDLKARAELLIGQLGSQNWDFAHLTRPSDPLAGMYLEVIAQDQRVVYASPNLQEARLPPPSRVGVCETLTAGPGVQVRVYSQHIQNPRATILVAQSLHALETSQKAAAGRILLLGLITLTLSLLVTGAALHRGLAPLRRVAQTARYIARTGDVKRRVPDPGSGDDVAQVALAFNSLVERVEQDLQTQLRLLGDTSHELRNPLTVILTDLDLLSRELDAETRAEVSAEANQEVQRLIRMVEQLLTLSWAEAHPVWQPETVRLDALLKRLAGRQTRAAEGQIRVTLPEQAVWVSGDPDRLSQIILNLLDNAIRHTPPGTPVHVKLERSGSRVLLSVRDEGPGIASPHLEHIFERFYRIDPSRNRGSGGAGLGLPLAQALARIHGGELTVSSHHGCSFTLDLPAGSEPEA